MQNIEVTILPDDILVLKVDLTQEIAYTASNRSIRVASTEGNLLLWHDGKPHPRGIKVNLNVFRNLTPEEKTEVAKTRRSTIF